MKKKLTHWFPSALLLAVAAALVAVPTRAADRPEKPDVTLPPGEMTPTAFVAFTKAQTEDAVDWSIKDARIPDVWEKGITGKGYVGGVIDTGTDAAHPDLAGQELSGKDFTGKGTSKDGNGHGSWCFGHVFALRDGKGTVGGAFGAKGRTYKVLSDQGSGYTTDIAKGIDQAVADKCDVISMSLGSRQPDADTLAAIKRAIAAGVIVCCAAGNDGPGQNTVGYPGGYAATLPLVLCVAAHDVTGLTARFSSRGAAVTLTCGGVNTKSTWVGGQYAAIDGTSMATPTAMSLALLWLEAGGGRLPKTERPAAFVDALVKSCDLYPQRNASRGYGRPDANKLCAAVPPVAPPQPPAERTVTVDTPELRAQGIKRLVVVLDGAAPVPSAVPVHQPAPVPVQGYWQPAIQQPWYPAVPSPLPMTMPAPVCGPGGCPGGVCPTPVPAQWYPGQRLIQLIGR